MFELRRGVIIYDRVAGRRIAMNATVRSIEATDPEFQRLARVAHELARRTAGSCESKADRAAAGPVHPRATCATTRSLYRLSSARLPAGIAEAHEVVAVMVVRVDRSAPELFGLIDRCGFTRREADVARALTAGRSNREIARQLAISPHTVRHHLERVFAKLGVSTRNEALIELLRRPDYEGDVTGPE